MADEMDDITASAHSEDEDNYYTLVGEQGMCLVDDAIINLKKVVVIRQAGGKTLVYTSGGAQPIELPATAFEVIRDAVFAIDDFGDDDLEDDEEEVEEV